MCDAGGQKRKRAQAYSDSDEDDSSGEDLNAPRAGAPSKSSSGYQKPGSHTGMRTVELVHLLAYNDMLSTMKAGLMRSPAPYVSSSFLHPGQQRHHPEGQSAAPCRSFATSAQQTPPPPLSLPILPHPTSIVVAEWCLCLGTGSMLT